MKAIIDYFSSSKRVGGAFEEEVHLERLGAHYELSDMDFLEFILLSLQAGAHSFYDEFTRDGTSS